MALLMKAINIIACFFLGSIIISLFNVTDVSNAAINTNENFDSVITPINRTTMMELPPSNTISNELEPNKMTPIQIECLTRNLYFEARGEGEHGMKAVAYTTINRVNSGLYPTSICGVVYQGERHGNGELKRNRCQFSWVCDGTVKKIRQPQLYELSKKVAEEVVSSYSKETDPTKGSLYYHATSINHKQPFKKMRVAITTTIGNHVFYRKKG